MTLPPPKDAPDPSPSRSPLVSVLCGVHNGAAFLEASVRSVLNQTFSDFELLLLDDGSTDETPRILDNLAETDRRIRVFHRRNRGLTPTLCEGVSLATGTYIARQDDDDISLPERLAVQVAYLEAHPAVAAVGCRYRTIDTEDRVIGKSNVPLSSSAIKRALLTHNVIPHSGAMFHREKISALGGYDTQYKTAQDYDLWCRIALHHELANIETPLLLRRKHPAQIGARRTGEQRAARDRIRRTYRRGVIRRTGDASLPLSVRLLARLYTAFDGDGKREDTDG